MLNKNARLLWACEYPGVNSSADKSNAFVFFCRETFCLRLANKIIAFDHVSQVAAAQCVTYGCDVVFVLNQKKNTCLKKKCLYRI